MEKLLAVSYIYNYKQCFSMVVYLKAQVAKHFGQGKGGSTLVSLAPHVVRKQV